MNKVARFVVVLLVSVGGGFLGGYLHHARLQPAPSAPAPVGDIPIDEVARRAKDLVMQEMRESFRERVSQRNPKKESEKQDISALPLVEIEDFKSFGKELEENEVAFFANYGNKRIRIVGAKVNTVKIGAEWQEYAAEVELTVPTIEGAYEVGEILRCRVNPDQLDAVARIKEGQEVVVVGVPTKGTAPWPILSDCTITVVEK